MITTETFIKKSKEIHGDLYDYSKSIYVNSRTKIWIGCKVHGFFQTTPTTHLRSKCRKCVDSERGVKTQNTFDKFYSKLSKFHKEKYDYSLMDNYSFGSTQTFICPIHGKFLQKIKNHIASKGCYECGRESFKKTTFGIDLNRIKSALCLYKIKAKLNKNQIYRLSDKIEITCRIHGKKTILLKSLLRSNGTGCVDCRFKGHSRTEFLKFCKARKRKRALFYLIRIYKEKEEFFKIGITSVDIKQRFRKLTNKTGYQYEILRIVENTPLKIWNLENKMKKKFKEFKYTPVHIFPGYTECFSHKILEYDF